MFWTSARKEKKENRKKQGRKKMKARKGERTNGRKSELGWGATDAKTVRGLPNSCWLRTGRGKGKVKTCIKIRIVI